MKQGIPSLNLGKVRIGTGGSDSDPALDSTLTAGEVDNRASNTPTEGDGVEEDGSELGEDSYRDYSYRDYSAAPTPHTSRTVDAGELLGCSVYEITDVAVLQSKLIDAQKLFVQLESWYGKELERKEERVSNMLRSLTYDRTGSARGPGGSSLGAGGVSGRTVGGVGNASNRSGHGGLSHLHISTTPRGAYVALNSPHTATGSSIPSTSHPGTGRGGPGGSGSGSGGGGNRTPHFRSLPPYQDTTTSKLRASQFSPSYGTGGDPSSARGTNLNSARSGTSGFPNGSTPVPRGGQSGYPTTGSSNGGAGNTSSRLIGSARGGQPQQYPTPRSGRVESSTPQFSSRSRTTELGGAGNSSARGGGGNSSARGVQQQSQQQQPNKRSSWDSSSRTSSNNYVPSSTTSYGNQQQQASSGYGASPQYRYNKVSPRRTTGVSGSGPGSGPGVGSSGLAKRRAMTPRF